jgi:hypothetical protein
MTVMAMFLLGTIILNTNSNLLTNEQTVMDSEFGVAAISLATSLVEEAQGKMFDEASVDSGVTDVSQLATAASLGKDANELYRYAGSDTTMSDFDDLDDFNNFSIEFVNDTTKPLIAQYRGESKGFRADYFVRSKVEYVTATTSAITPTSSKTWHKLLTVTVTSPTSRDTLKFPTVISYWN